jgi:hypothetical protein
MFIHPVGKKAHLIKARFFCLKRKPFQGSKWMSVVTSRISRGAGRLEPQADQPSFPPGGLQ